LAFTTPNLSNTLAGNILELSAPKNDFSGLVKFFPGYRVEDVLVDLELWFSEIDNIGDALQRQSTPDVKLHYPEPFIASPSFTHEEI
jgi:hypothetical protein